MAGTKSEKNFLIFFIFCHLAHTSGFSLCYNQWRAAETRRPGSAVWDREGVFTGAAKDRAAVVPMRSAKFLREEIIPRSGSEE